MVSNAKYAGGVSDPGYLTEDDREVRVPLHLREGRTLTALDGVTLWCAF